MGEQPDPRREEGPVRRRPLEGHRTTTGAGQPGQDRSRVVFPAPLGLR